MILAIASPFNPNVPNPMLPVFQLSACSSEVNSYLNTFCKPNYSLLNYTVTEAPTKSILIWFQWDSCNMNLSAGMSSLAKNFSIGSLNWLITLLFKLILTTNWSGFASTLPFTLSITNSMYQNLLLSSLLNTKATLPESSTLKYEN